MLKLGDYLSSLGKLLFVVWLLNLMLNWFEVRSLPWWGGAAIALVVFSIGFAFRFYALGKDDVS
ncbi:hypothetical protein [Ghiorsea bivora]|uniref:hypothetical protein n=1 Tax=Ghiorsea bivora TaxID=1485545 RepID=UPI000570CE8A|nr:hypothetical protein [Ghiorsea bivora]